MILFARFVSVSVPLLALRKVEPSGPYEIRIMTLAGLRGGISIAMAVSAPAFPGRDVLVCVVYCCVVFSLLGQAMALAPYIRSLGLGSTDQEPEPETPR